MKCLSNKKVSFSIHIDPLTYMTEIFNFTIYISYFQKSLQNLKKKSLVSQQNSLV